MPLKMKILNSLSHDSTELHKNQSVLILKSQVLVNKQFEKTLKR